jgi:hypothetical protein
MLAAQAAVEYSTATATGTTGAATAGKSSSKAIGGVFNKLSKTLDKATVKLIFYTMPAEVAHFQ